MKTFASRSLEETERIATLWFVDISERCSGLDEALVVGLRGHLGAGKTAFVKIVAKLLGIRETVTSPTFVLMKMYEIAGSRNIPWKRFIHIDAYRLEEARELEALDFEQLVADGSNLIMVEWPENVGLKEFLKDSELGFEIKDGAHHISIR